MASRGKARIMCNIFSLGDLGGSESSKVYSLETVNLFKETISVSFTFLHFVYFTACNLLETIHFAENL